MKVCVACGARYEGGIEICPLDRAPLAPAQGALCGRRIRGVYRLIDEIGRGGIASVYRACHDALGREVAVKVLAPAAARNPALRARFLREGRAANRIRHPNVIEIADVGEEDDGLTYLVMALIPGETLAAAVSRGPLPPPLAVTIALALTDALTRAHELGVLHRDLKPANVMLSPRAEGPPQVTLLDFGLAKIKGELGLTATGALCGTPAYLAPEQVLGEEASASGDLYALGCVLFEMLTGTPPFTGTATEVFDRHLREAAPYPSSRTEGVPAWLDEVVERALAKSPDHRFPSAAAFASALARGGPAEPDPTTLDALSALGEAIRGLDEARLALASATDRAAAERSFQAQLDAVVTQGRALLLRG